MLKLALAASVLALVPVIACPQTTPPAQSGQPAEPGAPLPDWVARGAVELEVLDKVDAVSREYTVRVGQSVQVGSLTLALQACEVRPPDRPADSAAYLTITDSHPDEPGFRGWMLANEPWVAMLQSPLYDVRVLRCQP